LTIRAPIRRLLVLTLGWSLVLLGIAGLVLPFLQGLLMILIGLIILSSEYHWARRLLAKLEARFPKISSAARRAIANANQWLRRRSFWRKKGSSQG
jgi:uncharacterized protein